MQPSFPTLTFPNHYSMITGLYPSSHGIVANMFFDPKFNEDFNYKIPDKSWDPKWWGGQPVRCTLSLWLCFGWFMWFSFQSRHTNIFAFTILWLLVDLGDSSAPEPKVSRYHVARWRIRKTRSTNIPYAIQIQQPCPGESRGPSEMDRSSKGGTPDRHGSLHLGDR